MVGRKMGRQVVNGGSDLRAGQKAVADEARKAQKQRAIDQALETAKQDAKKIPQGAIDQAREAARQTGKLIPSDALPVQFKPGDSQWHVVVKKLGLSPATWAKAVDMNAQYKKNPSLVLPEQVMFIPADAGATKNAGETSA